MSFELNPKVSNHFIVKTILQIFLIYFRRALPTVIPLSYYPRLVCRNTGNNYRLSGRRG
jgi:hypothetical protein